MNKKNNTNTKKTTLNLLLNCTCKTKAQLSDCTVAVGYDFHGQDALLLAINLHRDAVHAAVPGIEPGTTHS